MEKVFVDPKNGGIWWYEAGVLIYAPMDKSGVVNLEDAQEVENLGDPDAINAQSVLGGAS